MEGLQEQKPGRGIVEHGGKQESMQEGRRAARSAALGNVKSKPELFRFPVLVDLLLEARRGEQRSGNCGGS